MKDSKKEEQGASHKEIEAGCSLNKEKMLQSLFWSFGLVYGCS